MMVKQYWMLLCVRIINMPVAKKNKEFDRIYAEYRDKYDVDSLTNPNDVANLETMIRNQLLIGQLQDQLDALVNSDKLEDVIDPNGIKKILDSIVALSQTNVNYERTLGIDRKTRKQQQEGNIVDTVLRLKALARQFIDDDRRLLKVMCKTCKIMVGRISGVYDTTEYSVAFQCPQCKKHTTVTRKERDIFFDVKDANWRRKYPIEIIQPKAASKDAPTFDLEDDMMITGEDDLGIIYE